MQLRQLELLLDQAAEKRGLAPETVARMKHDLAMAASEADDPMPEWWPAQLVAAGVGPKELERRGHAYRERRFAEQAGRGRRRLLAERIAAGLAGPVADTGTTVPSGQDAATVAPVRAAGGHPADAPAEAPADG